MLIQEHPMSAIPTDQISHNTLQSKNNSAISSLRPQNARQHLQNIMNRRIHDVANGPSSSNSNLLQGLLALKARDYQNAPGSDLVLPNKGGLPGGGWGWGRGYGYPYGNWRNNYSGYSGSSSSSSRGLRIVNPDPGDGSSCSVCAMACASGLSYATVWNTALRHGFKSDSGMEWSEMEDTLDELGVDNRRFSQPDDWDDLPDLAIIGVHGETSPLHAVVFERRSNGSEYIWDSRNDYPVRRSGYHLYGSSQCIKIIK